MNDKHTPGPWHVNAIANGRIIGDASAPGADKLTINSHNATVATVYRPSDARFIAQACNAHADLLAACESAITSEGALAFTSQAAAFRRLDAINATMRAAIAKAKGDA